MKGAYRIEEVLGHGGFGITYLAHDNYLDKKVAFSRLLLIQRDVFQRQPRPGCPYRTTIKLRNPLEHSNFRIDII